MAVLAVATIAAVVKEAVGANAVVIVVSYSTLLTAVAAVSGC